MQCAKCLNDSSEKVDFRSQCLHCGQDLHTCSHCEYYCIGKPNDCLIPGTEWVRDREKANFCEDFKEHTRPFSKIDPDIKRRKFNSLFKEDLSDG